MKVQPISGVPEATVRSNLRQLLALAAITAAATLAAGCSEDQTSTPVTPPALDAQFLGYTDTTSQQTTCGNCHVDLQQRWAATGHANAWGDLQASGHANSSCNACHTTSGFGNAAGDTSGFAAVDANAQHYYYDVQCESCHGPGAAHASGPESVQPLASIMADTGATNGCATCHNGSHHPFDAEWKQSRHALAEDHMTSNASCQPCHEGRRRLAMLDPNAMYAELTSGPPQAITCTVCHDPHGSDNPAELRKPVDAASLSGNLCMNCHGYRLGPVVGSSRGNQGHGTQGGVLLGQAGWLPPGFTAAGLQGSHTSSSNPDLCVGCHVESYSATTAQGTFYSTGHTFLAIPCVDPATGMPDTLQACTSLADRRFAACARSGCHSSEDAARGAFTATEARVNYYVRTLWIDVDHDKTIDAFPADSGLLPRVKAMSPSYINSTDSTITVGDGAEFNTRMFAPNLADHPDGSHGAHNPFYYEALLIATIDAVRSTYGIPAPPAEARLFATRRAALHIAQ
jgi:predicted CXXCH cytochrome family protein